MQILINGQTIQFSGEADGLTRYAAASALSKTAKMAGKAVRVEMGKVFDRPTPYILNSLLVIPARKDKLEATVKFRDYASSRVAPEKYMLAHVLGGGRAMKRSERNVGEYLRPTDTMTLDKYGNVPSGTMTKILSNIGRNSDSLSNTNKGNRVKDNRYFFGEARHHDKGYQAVYLRQGSKLTPVMFIQKREPQYRPTLAFYEIINHVADVEFYATYQSEMVRMGERFNKTVKI